MPGLWEALRCCGHCHEDLVCRPGQPAVPGAKITKDDQKFTKSCVSSFVLGRLVALSSCHRLKLFSSRTRKKWKMMLWKMPELHLQLPQQAVLVDVFWDVLFFWNPYIYSGPKFGASRKAYVCVGQLRPQPECSVDGRSP